MEHLIVLLGVAILGGVYWLGYCDGKMSAQADALFERLDVLIDTLRRHP